MTSIDFQVYAARARAVCSKSLGLAYTYLVEKAGMGLAQARMMVRMWLADRRRPGPRIDDSFYIGQVRIA